MQNGNTHNPVILLLKDGPAADKEFIRRWLLESRFMTCEAVNAFEAIEEMSDFTMRERPDVIILDIESPKNDLPLIREIVKTSAGELDPSIISMCDVGQYGGEDDFYARDLGQVAARLETLIPNSSTAN